MLTKRNLLEMRIRRSRIGTAKYRRNDQYERRKDFSRKKVRGRAADMHQICFVVYRSMRQRGGRVKAAHRPVSER